jgi:hypothetical protein
LDGSRFLLDFYSCFSFEIFNKFLNFVLDYFINFFCFYFFYIFILFVILFSFYYGIFLDFDSFNTFYFGFGIEAEERGEGFHEISDTDFYHSDKKSFRKESEEEIQFTDEEARSVWKWAAFFLLFGMFVGQTISNFTLYTDEDFK